MSFSYAISVLTFIVLAACGLFALKLLWAVICDVASVVSFILTVKKNEKEHKKYTDEKAKNLEKERQLRLQKGQELMQSVEAEHGLDESLINIVIEPPPKEHVWRTRMFLQQLPLYGQIRGLLKRFGRENVIGRDGRILWQARISAQRRARATGRDRDQYHGR